METILKLKYGMKMKKKKKIKDNFFKFKIIKIVVQQITNNDFLNTFK